MLEDCTRQAWKGRFGPNYSGSQTSDKGEYVIILLVAR